MEYSPKFLFRDEVQRLFTNIKYTTRYKFVNTYILKLSKSKVFLVHLINSNSLVCKSPLNNRGNKKKFKLEVTEFNSKSGMNEDHLFWSHWIFQTYCCNYQITGSPHRYLDHGKWSFRRNNPREAICVLGRQRRQFLPVTGGGSPLRTPNTHPSPRQPWLALASLIPLHPSRPPDSGPLYFNPRFTPSSTAAPFVTALHARNSK